MNCPNCGSSFVVISQDSKKFWLKICLGCRKDYVEFKEEPMKAVELPKEGPAMKDGRQFPIVGRGTKIWEPHLSNIHPDVVIGSECKIHSHVWIGEGVRIGDRVKIQAFSFIPSGVTIEDNVFIGPRVTFTNDKYPPSGGSSWLPTLVKRNAVIGAGAVILPGVTIGQNARVGAGAIVTKSVPDNVTVCGNPAQVHNKR